MSSEGWKGYKLGDIIDDVAMGPFGSNIKTDNFISSGVPVIRGSNLNEGGFEDKHFVFISEEKAQSLKRSLAFPDDLVFTHRGTIGQVGIIPHNRHPKYLVSQSQLKLTVNKEYLVPKYLYYFFKSPIGQYELLKNTSQVGVPAIASPTKSIKEVDIQIPSTSIQRRITSILSSLDDKIELNRQTNQTLEAIAHAIFKEWFVDFNFPGATGETQDSELGKIPKGWTIKSVNEICEVTDYVANGSFASLAEKVKYKAQEDYAVLIRLVDYNRDYTGEFVYINADAYNFLSKSKLVGDEIIIANVGANAGQVFRTPKLDKPLSLGPNTIMIKPNPLSHYLYLHFRSNSGQAAISSLITGSAQPKFNKTDFRKLKVLVPEKPLILVFNEIYKALEGMVDNNNSQTKTLTQLRDSLLPKLMKGEITVK